MHNMKSRDYQLYGVASIFRYFAEGNKGNPIVAMPTGTGKSHVIAEFLSQVYHVFPDQKIVIATHVQELIEQNFEKLIAMWPTAPAGIYSAGLGRKELDAPILFVGVQSAVNKAEAFGFVDLLFIDEAHLVSPAKSTSYQKFIATLKKANPKLKVIGLSATPYRMGQGMLTEGGLFTDICFDMTTMASFNWLLDEGYLSPLVPKRTSMQLDLESVRVQGGEFVNKDLQQAVDKDEITYKAVLETIEFGVDRNCWLVFATGIDHALHITAVMELYGIPTTCIHSKLTKDERTERLAGLKSGKYRAAVNNNILTTGFDLPSIDLIAVIRPTNSPGLWVQMLGRGTRPVYAPGFDLWSTAGRLAAIEAGSKQDCLVLDFAGNTRRLGPINDPVLPRKKGDRKGVAPVRLCENCSIYIHASIRVCPKCGFEFPISTKFGFTAGTDELIAKADEPQVETLTVDRVVYLKHQKQGRPDAIVVHYHCGLRRFKEFICLEHGGYAATKARQWWRCAWPTDVHGEIIPETTKQALNMVSQLKTPTAIDVWVNKKYPEVMNHAYPQG